MFEKNSTVCSGKDILFFQKEERNVSFFRKMEGRQERGGEKEIKKERGDGKSFLLICPLLYSLLLTQ